jgi:hypothetical protein
MRLRTNPRIKCTQTFTQHLQAFIDIYKDFERQSKDHCHDVLLKTRRLSRKNIKEREENITTHLVSQTLTRSHKCPYFGIPEQVQLEPGRCLHCPLNKARCRYLNLTTVNPKRTWAHPSMHLFFQPLQCFLYTVPRCLHQMKELNHNQVNSILILNIKVSTEWLAQTSLSLQYDKKDMLKVECHNLFSILDCSQKVMTTRATTLS